jgi:hypothetical protein
MFSVSLIQSYQNNGVGDSNSQLIDLPMVWAIGYDVAQANFDAVFCALNHFHEENNIHPVGPRPRRTIGIAFQASE